MGFRSDFYSLLLDEVKQFSFDLPETSALPFLAAQLAENKNFSASSAVSILRKLDEQYYAKEIDERKYFYGLLNVALDKKIRIQEKVFQQILLCRDLFPYPGRKQYEKIHEETGEERIYRLYYRKAEEILHSLEKEDLKPITEKTTAIEQLSYMFISEALVQEAKAYLYDAGFSVNQTKQKNIRKLDHSMQMVDSFFERKDSAYFLQGYDPRSASGTIPDSEKILETKKLFSLLDRDADFDSVVVPVVIDPETGAGLYIYGMETDDDPVYLNNEVLKRRAMNGHHCFYTIFEYWGSQRDTDDSDYAPGRLIYRQYISNRDSKYESTGYADLEDAIHDFQKVIREDVADMYLYNEKMPEGCPESFRKYFPQDEDEEDLFSADKEKLAIYREAERKAREQDQIIKDFSPVHY